MMTEWTWKKILRKSRLFFFNLNPLTKLRCGTYPSFQLPERESKLGCCLRKVQTAPQFALQEVFKTEGRGMVRVRK
jgi:hypothetical protein